MIYSRRHESFKACESSAARQHTWEKKHLTARFDSRRHKNLVIIPPNIRKTTIHHRQRVLKPQKRNDMYYYPLLPTNPHKQHHQKNTFAFFFSLPIKTHKRKRPKQEEIRKRVPSNLTVAGLEKKRERKKITPIKPSTPPEPHRPPPQPRSSASPHPRRSPPRPAAKTASASAYPSSRSASACCCSPSPSPTTRKRQGQKRASGAPRTGQRGAWWAWAKGSCRSRAGEQTGQAGMEREGWTAPASRGQGGSIERAAKARALGRCS